MKQFSDHAGHLLWSLGLFYKHFILLDFKECREIYYWTKIHLTYDGVKLSSGKWSLSTFTTQCIGFVVTIGIFQGIFYLFF